MNLHLIKKLYNFSKIIPLKKYLKNNLKNLKIELQVFKDSKIAPSFYIKSKLTLVQLVWAEVSMVSSYIICKKTRVSTLTHVSRDPKN